MENRTKTSEVPSAMDKAAGVVYWLRLFLSPVLGSAFIAALVYLAFRTLPGAMLSAGVFLLGCGAGYRLAEGARKGAGTVEFAARTMHNVEFDPQASGKKQ